MSDTLIQDVSCGAFRRLPEDALQPEAIHRFVVGEDTTVRRLTREQAAQELTDPFATLLLLNGVFPRTAGDVLAALDEKAPAGSPLRTRLFFLVGEGTQIPFSAETAGVRRNLRFLVTTQPGPGGPDLMLSSFNPAETDVELMAWDETRGGFNYYRTVGQSTGWVFAGNSRHALTPPTEGKGPFETHASGNLIMKELRSPWMNWHSPDAPIQQAIFAPDDPLRDHPWFRNLEPLGAVTCEGAVVRPSIKRWARKRFEQLLADAGTVAHPERIMRQVLATPTVNLISSHTEGELGASGETVDLPQTFFIDSEGLTELLALPAPPPFSVAGSVYSSSLQTFAFTLTDGEGFEAPGDTHFAFSVPERAFEDQAVLAEAVRTGLVSKRLAACLLMTDFPNPVFSERRASLLRFVPESATVTNGSSEFSEQMAERILAAAADSAADSPEQEFKTRWQVGDADWPRAFGAQLTEYYTAVTAQLATQEGFDAYTRLAESRRRLVAQRTPLVESPLLFATTNIPGATRSMRPDGTVAEEGS